MVLRGSLESLPATDLLQFLTQSGKSGTLRISDGPRSKLLSFSQGQLGCAVGQHELPPLQELLDYLQLNGAATAGDEQIDASAARQRMRERSRGLRERPPIATLGKILVQQGRIAAADLETLLEPENLPERFLERLLVEHAGLSLARILEVRQGSPAEQGLVEGLVSTRTISREAIVAAIAAMKEDDLAELLVFHGVLKRSEAQFTVGQLVQLRDHARPRLRLGDYLLAQGLVTPRQLEKALGEQQSWHLLLGEILVEQGVVHETVMERAQEQMAALRFEFSPLYPLFARLRDRCGISLDEFLDLQERLGQDEHQSLAELLIKTGRVDREGLEQIFRDLLIHEICDMMLWTEGSYEFFEGFTLEDALQMPDWSKIHEGRFDLGSVLLDAHYQVDELRRGRFAEMREDVVLVAGDPGDATRAFVDEEDRRLLRRCDGRRPLLEICAVLPGNTLSHRQRILDFVERGLLRPLTREESWLAAQACLAAEDHAQAQRFCQHALQMPGPEPTDLRLRTALQDARLACERGLFGGLVLGLRRGLGLLRDLPGVRSLSEWLRRRRLVCQAQQGFEKLGRRLRGILAQRSLRWSNALENLLLRTGLNRHWWLFHARFIAPLGGWMRRPSMRLGVVASAGIALAVLMLLPGVPQLPQQETEWRWDPSKGGANYPPGWQPRSVRQRSGVLEIGAPLSGAPVEWQGHLVFSGRDGKLHGYARDEQGLRQVFATAVGEYGDILSPPVSTGSMLLVTNVSSGVFGVDAQGQEVWHLELPRTEALQPVPLGTGSEGSVDAVAVCAQESVRILDPATGAEKQAFATGNRLLCPPVADGARLFVGSADNHVYCLDWAQGEVVWDQQVGEDVRFLQRVGDLLLALVRGERLLALDPETGALRWRVEIGEGPALRLAALSAKRVYVSWAGGRLKVYDLESGTPLSRFTPHPSLKVRWMLPVRDQYLYVNEAGYVGQLDGAGVHRWRSLESVGEVADFRVVGSQLLVASAVGELHLFALGEGLVGSTDPTAAPPARPGDAPR